ncbi:hypothetical protein [Egicoccus halophilus]|uniref:hypothetical protein n=1 Tax=Egicoccus halophilus TaxID=1670830 RepID=UPI001031A374|nr:hypothetical protein [Egicoccus halophilus]
MARGSGRTLGIAAACTAFVMGGVGLAHLWRGIEVGVLMGDPAAVLDAPFYLGAVTLLRTTVLAMAAGGCLTAAWALRGRRDRNTEFVGVLGLGMAVLVLDDKFQGHEAVLGNIAGVPEAITFTAMGAVAVAVVVRYAEVVRARPDAWAAPIAIALFAASAVVDRSGHPWLNNVVETTLEVAGITALAVFGARAGLALLQQAPARNTDTCTCAVR